jgi:hypothetical protein
MVCFSTLFKYRKNIKFKNLTQFLLFLSKNIENIFTSLSYIDMESIMNDIDVEKPLPSIIVIECTENHFYRIGLSLFSFGSRKRNRFHNPFFISFIISVQTFKSITVILMKEDKYRLLLIGDFAYFINCRNFMNSAIILSSSLTLFSQLLHYWKYYKNESPSYLKPFEMISGLVSPKSIGLFNREDINQLLKRSKLMFGVSRLLIIGTTFALFFLSGIPLIINSPLSLVLIEILWILLFTFCGYYCAHINLSQMTYFYIICLYLKLKLRNANNSIRKCFEKKYKMANRRIKNILISLNAIISEINIYNNDLWSKYLMIVLIIMIITLDLVFFEAIFGKMNLFLKIILFYASSIFFLLLIILINTASSVSFEANKSYKLLNKMFITNNKQISIRMRIKVWIQKINLFFILKLLYMRPDFSH